LRKNTILFLSNVQRRFAMSVNDVEIKVGQLWEVRSGDRAYVTGVCEAGLGGAVPPFKFILDNGQMVSEFGACRSFGRSDQSDLMSLLKDVPEAFPIPELPPELWQTATGVRMDAPGYESLANVLQLAYNQAAVGKGVERHAAAGEPFDKQVMQIGAAKFGTGALLFQAFKKSEESQRLPHDRAINELLGAIVYLAGAVIALERVKASS
jgi:hypothetical protein